MSLSPANLLHHKTFFGRMIRPAIFVFFLGFISSGIFAGFWERGIELPVLQMAQRQFSRLPQDFTAMPRVCLEGNASSTFQEQVCKQRWSTLFFRILSVSFPFFCVLLFLRVAYRIVWGAYQEADRKLREGRESFLGTVTDPPLLSNDFYGWFHSLISVSVQLKNGRQIKVYVPLEADLPKPGAQLAIAPLGRKFGATRAMGIVFIPHVSVVSGQR